MSNSSAVLNAELSRKTSLLGMKLWVIIGLVVGAFIVVIIFMVFLCLGSWRKSKRLLDKIPVVSKEIKEVSSTAEKKGNAAGGYDSSSNNNSARFLASKKYADSEGKLVKDNGDEGSSQLVYGTGSSGYSVFKSSSSHHAIAISLPEISYLGWGYWFTLRDLEIATDCFAKENIVGEGGYGVVYKGQLSNGTLVAVKSLFNNLGQAEKEFTVEVEAIGRVRHKNLVRLLGYCVEGTHRILVYEYVGNGNLEQWLHVSKEQRGVLTWEARMKIIYGTAKALAYLHEAIEPKVVHRDIKSSNILIDEDFNAKVSDFGLAKLLGSGESHVTTRVMGTFGYVAPEYANTGLLNERSDVYSFGILLLEAITGREPVDYNRPPGEVNLVDWLKTLIANGRCEDVVDPNLQVKPPIRALKKALLVALKCIDPNADRRPRMGQVVHMHESEEERKPAGRPVRARAGNPEKPAPRLKQSSSSNSRLSISGCSRMHK